MKLIIVSPVNAGEGFYQLVTEEGEVLASHFCSSAGFAKGDLIEHRAERKTEYTKRFPEGYEVVFLEESGLTYDELLDRNQAAGSGT